MPINKRHKTRIVLLSATLFLLSGCISPEAGYSEQQERMMRCDQYIGDARDECLRGIPVTIEDYKTDLREFERDEKKKRDEAGAAAKANEAAAAEKAKEVKSN